MASSAPPPPEPAAAATKKSLGDVMWGALRDMMLLLTPKAFVKVRTSPRLIAVCSESSGEVCEAVDACIHLYVKLAASIPPEPSWLESELYCE